MADDHREKFSGRQVRDTLDLQSVIFLDFVVIGRVREPERQDPCFLRLVS